MLSKRKILLATAVFALAVRLLFAQAFSQTIFADYHLVPGLDMQTLLRFSEWTGEGKFPAFFTFHRLWIFLVWFVNGQHHCAWAVFICQTLLGITGCMAAADIIRKFTRSRRAALAGGMLMSLYLPLLVYEFSILQETFMVNFALLAFWSILHAVHKRFAAGSGIVAAVLVFAALAGRPAALLWCGVLCLWAIYKMFRHRRLKRLILPGTVLVVLLVSAAVFNRINYGMFTPVYYVLPYTVQYNLQPDTGKAPTGNDVTAYAVWKSAVKAAGRISKLFKYGELPENQNVYFWEKHHILFALLPGSGIVIPLAVAGIMVLLLSGAWRTRYGILLLPLLTMALPLCAREPIGRYRLMLVPYFFMIGVCAVVIFCRLKSARKRGIVLLGAGIGAVFAFYDGEVPQRIRPADHHAGALALEAGGRASAEIVLSRYFRYWEAENFSSQRAFRVMMDKSLHYKDIRQALAVTKQAEGRINPDLIEYYRAWCFVLLNQPEQVDFHLRRIRNVRSLPPDAYKNAFMLRDKTVELLKRSRL